MRLLTPTRRGAAALLLIAAALLPSGAGGQGAGNVLPKLPFTKFVMKNGLTVLLSENHAAPTVSVWMVYRVGRGDFDPGRTGFAHLFEHVMFEGSAHVARGEHSKLVKESGGATNATTWEDYTDYFDTDLPSNMLETALWLEADRMAFLPAALDSAHFDLARQSVYNEHTLRTVGVNVVPPGVLAAEAFATNLLPSSRYSVPVFGYMEDLARSSVADVRSFFDRYYGPNNATLAISGDFKTASARALVEKYFGGIPARARPASAHPAIAPLAGEKRIALEDQYANTYRLWIGWHGASTKGADRMALSVLNSILAGGRGSRLSRAVTDAAKAGTVAESAHSDLDDSGIFQIGVAGLPNASLTRLEQLVDSVTADVRDHGVSDIELKRWVATYVDTTLSSLQLNATRAKVLAEGQSLNGDPSAALNDIATVRRLTPADLQRVARQYLTGDRLVLSIVPKGKLDLVSKPELPYTNVTKKVTP
jgi:zinc protease